MFNMSLAVRNSPLLRNLTLFIWAVISLFFLVLLFSPGKASAYSGNDTCLGTAGGNVNIVVFVRIEDSTGKLIRYSDNFRFTVESYKKTPVSAADSQTFDQYRYNSIIYRNNGTAEARGGTARTLEVQRTRFTGTDSGTDMASGKGNLCRPWSGAAGLHPSYAFRDGDNTALNCFPNGPGAAGIRTGCPVNGTNRPDSDNNQSWVLSCLASEATAYRFTNPTILDQTGGTWIIGSDSQEGKMTLDWVNPRHVNIYATNGEELNTLQKRIVFTYQLPAEPRITPNATVNGSPNDITVQTNQDVTFRNWAAVTNSPTNNGTFGVAIEDVFGNIPGGAWGPNTRNIINNDYPNDRRPLVIRFSETGQYCLRTRIFSVPSGVTTPAGLSVMRCVNVTDAPPPPAASCSGFTITMERTESRSFALNTSYAPPTPLPTNYVDPQVTWTVSGTGLNGATLTGIPASGTAPRTPIFTVSSGGIGTWQVTWGLTDGSVSGCIGTVSTEAKPYFKVFNGDVQAGTQFRTNGGSCTGTPTGRISAYNKGAGSSYAGSGSQIAAFALQPIQEFTSANRNPSLNPSVSLPRALTFANNGGSGYGGGSAMTACVPDYFGQRSPSLPATTGPRNLSTLITSSTITGLQQTIYVDGDLTIDTNITYAPWTAGSGEPPQRWFVVKGNIHVLPNVTQLAGVFVAQPKNDGTAGVFYTCSNGIGTPSHSMMVNECSTNRLTVNGAVMARRVELNRSQGTVAQAVSGESVAANNSAEVFIFNPLTWFSTPPGLSANDTSDYDALINLPPVL